MNNQELKELQDISAYIDKKAQALLFESHNKINDTALNIYGDCKRLIFDILNNFDTSGYVLKITHHGGKMAGIPSLSTNRRLNRFCYILSQDNNMICNKCYAEKSIKMYKQLDAILTYNTLLLKYTIINTYKQIDNLNLYKYFRFEAFGDVQGGFYMVNILNIIMTFKECYFCIFTKHHSEVLKYSDVINKLDNFNVVLSNYFINTPDNLPYIDKMPNKYKYFSVYDNEYIKQNNMNINCLKKCADCLKCYTKNNIKIINERLK